MPYGGDVFIPPIDQPDDACPFDYRAGYVTLASWPPPLDRAAARADVRPIESMQAWAGEEDFHAATLITFSARGPKRWARSPVGFSSSGTSTLATEKPEASASSGTTTTETIPLARS